jgi:hypothetical protein
LISRFVGTALVIQTRFSVQVLMITVPSLYEYKASPSMHDAKGLAPCFFVAFDSNSKSDLATERGVCFLICKFLTGTKSQFLLGYKFKPIWWNVSDNFGYGSWRTTD